MFDYIIIGLIALILLIALWPHKKNKKLSQKNIHHIEWAGNMPILKSRVNHEKLEIKTIVKEKGFLLFTGLSHEN